MFSATKGGSPSGYQISRSVRLRSSASAYFSRTATSTVTDNKKLTVSYWVKRGRLSTYTTSQIFMYSSGGDRIWFDVQAADTLSYYTPANYANVTGIFRDPSAWYHVVMAIDTTQATAANRVRVYVNGVERSVTGAYPTLNQAIPLNTASQSVFIGSDGSAGFFDGYLTEVNFIDGQALTPTSFGETNAVTGVWQPKKYTGTYGTNGFYLNFSDNSGVTATTIGKDYSGNGNNWTPNNISVTAGVTYDSMLDVPTQWADGGNGRGNYAVSNPINAASGLTVSDGNLKIAASAGGSKFVNSSISFPSSGAYYAEITFANASTNLIGQTIGIALGSRSLTAAYNAAGSYHFYASNTGSLLSNGTETSGLSAISANEVFQVAVDVTNSKMWIGRSNVWYNSTGGTTGNPSTGANPTFTAAFVDFFIFAGFDTTSAVSANFNFGQRPFAYTPPSGFKALNTLNLPTPTILKGNQYFNAVLYSGNSGSQSITGVGFQPDLVWGKSRNIAENNGLFDAVRGVNKILYSNLTNAEATDPGVSAFNSDGFSLNGATINATGYTYVAWNWKEGATQGFDIVTWTGTGAAQNISHNLGVAPAMIIWKYRSAASDWAVGHTRMNNGVNPWNYWAALNSTAAQAASAGPFNNTAPTSTQFTVGSFNANATNMVAYLFAEVAGFSKFGSYTGNGSTDGPFVFCGFRPRFILIKESTPNARGWRIFDTARNPYNQSGLTLSPNTSDAEDAGSGLYNQMDILSNGFKLRAGTNSEPTNESGATYIYAAFAESPFKNSLAR